MGRWRAYSDTKFCVDIELCEVYYPEHSQVTWSAGHKRLPRRFKKLMRIRLAMTAERQEIPRDR